MRNVSMVVAAMVAASVSASGQFRVGYPDPEISADEFRVGFGNPPRGFNEVPFWWWGGEKLDKKRLLWQLEEFHRAGISGTQVNYTHLRDKRGPAGWDQAPTDPAPFSDEWWDIFNFVAEESAKRGMGIGLSDYAIGFPGGNNLYASLGINGPETAAQILEMRPGGKVVPRRNPNTLDPLNPESANRMLRRFYGEFEKRLSPLALSALNYFFQDELLLAGDLRLWSDDFADEFKKRKGYDIVPKLAGLFTDIGPDTLKVRLDHNDVMVELTGERYFKPIYEWHAKRGLIYGCDNPSRGRNKMEYGDYMRAMRWYTAPGFDTPGTSADVVKNKMGSSIAHLYRRPRVWLEGYHSQGWQASAETVFDSSVHNFVYGASLYNLHGLYYSTYGGWWEWAPPCYHHHMPYWRHMPKFLKYFERLSFALSHGVHVADVAVLSPVEAAIYNRTTGRTAADISHAIITELATRRSVDCDYLDGDSLKAAEIHEGRLCVAGERYRAIVLPRMSAEIRPESRAKVEAFRKAGGVVAEYSGNPTAKQYDELIAALGIPDFKGPAGAKVLHRRVAGLDLYYLVDVQAGGVCTFRTQGIPEIWDLWNGTAKPCPAFERKADGTVSIVLEPSVQPVLLCFVPGKSGGGTPSLSTNDAKPSHAKALDGTWTFSLVPTMDNRWGDFRFPVPTCEKDRFIGAELRAFRSDLPGREGTCTVGFGPQLRTADGGMKDFSWRWGTENQPGYQNCHHGLCRVVGDEYMTLGRYGMGFGGAYRAMQSGPMPKPETFTTCLYAPEDCPAKFVASGVAPCRLVLGGREVKLGETVRVRKGYTPLEITWRDFGRTALVALRTDVQSIPSKTPLSMRWYDDPAVLRFDPFGGKVRTTIFKATVPPGFRAAELQLYGELVAATLDGRALQVALGADGRWTAAATAVSRAGGEIAFTIKPEPGRVGCGVFRAPVKLDCGEGDIQLGDWAVTEGLRCYSGGARYGKSFTLAAAEAERKVMLDLGKVSATCEISVNGDEPTVLCAPPWKVELTGRVKAGVNRISVTVFNTLNNHYQTVPTRYKRPTASCPSGLLGPVKLEFR